MTEHGSPFLKWAGGKQWLAWALRARISWNRQTYYEPFLGGGALFFSFRPEQSLLSDRNEDLVLTYRVVRDNVDDVIARLRRYDFTKRSYYRARSARPRSDAGRAARFIYLNRTCWNGLYRVNRQGEFNVPMGRFLHPPDFIGVQRLRAASAALATATIECCDFEKACSTAARGDLVYFDPPYTVTHENNGFLRYNEGIFSWADQERLARVAKDLNGRGVMVIVSNAAHRPIRRLYPGFGCWRVTRRSLLASDRSKRRVVAEYVIANTALGRIHDDTRLSWTRVTV